MKINKYIVLLISALLLAGCEMAFPNEDVATSEADLVVPTAVSANTTDATALPDASGSTDPNVGGGAPAQPPATDEPTAEPVEPTEEPTVVAPTVEPSATAVPPTATPVPPTETAVPPTSTPEPTIVPTPAVPHRTHIVVFGESLYTISLQYGLPWTEVAAANGITDPDTIYAGQILIIPGEGADNTPPQNGTHVVQVGENLYRIGLLYGLPWTVIADANGISDPTSVYVGQTLIIPAN